jgi:hypothetical protein
LHRLHPAAKLPRVNDDNANRKTAAIGGGAEIKSPADRVRQIQEMQRAMEAAPVARAAPAAPAAPVAAPGSTSQINDAFAVARALAVNDALKPDPKVHAELGRLQKDVGALFGGGKTDLELKGEPWKIISFLDAAPALFEPKQPMANYEPLVAQKGIVTKEGLLFEVGLKSKDGSEPVQKKQVLVGQDGKLRGAECKTPRDLERLLALPGFLPVAAKDVKAKESLQARFEVELSKTETLFFNNFGVKVPASANRSLHDITSSYHQDAFL